MWDCCKRDECKLDIQLNLWQYWISATVERDENVNKIRQLNFYIVKYVELLNEIRLWNWIRQVICETFEYVWTVEREMNVN